MSTSSIVSAPAPAAVPTTIEVHNPATGERLGELPVAGAAAVREAALRAREAQRAWGELSVRERCRRLRPFHRALSERLDELNGLLVAEGGKSQPDALTEASSLLVAARF